LIREHEPWHDQDVRVLTDVVLDDCYDVQGHLDGLFPGVIVDIGAHIGAFALMCRRWFGADVEYHGIEAHPLNWELLRRNVKRFGWRPVQAHYAAIDYCVDGALLLDSFVLGGTATGGSRVVAPGEEHLTWGHPFAASPLDCTVSTLEEFCWDEGIQQIDLLKLDCEGSEHRIVDHFCGWHAVRTVVGEYHGREDWERRIKAHPVLCDWRYTELSRRNDKSIGIFLLENTEEHIGWLES